MVLSTAQHDVLGWIKNFGRCRPFAFNQGTLRALVRRGLVDYEGDYVVLTAEGLKVAK